MGLKYLPNPNTMLYLSDGSLTDKSGNANNGTYNGGMGTSNVGRFGNCFNFDGVDDYISMTVTSTLQPTTFTFVMVFNYKQLLANYTLGGVGVHQPGVNHKGFMLMTNSSGDIRFIVGNYPTQAFVDFYTSNKISTNKYNCAIATFNNTTKEGKVFLNGVFTTQTINVNINYTGAYASLGALQPLYGYSNMYLDSCILENREWTKSEIQKFYQQNFRP